jgi:thiamine biosynthesis lipoprotein
MKNMSDKKFPDRRDFLKIAAGTFVIASVPVAFRSRSKLWRRSIPVMGSTAEIAVIHNDERYAYAAMDAALREIQRVDKLMTRFSPASDIGRVNMSAPGTYVAVSPETAYVVAKGIEWAQSSDGAFDPGVAKIIDLWDVVHRHEPPALPQVKRLANRGFYKKIDADAKHGLIKLEGPDLAIDLGGIACGYGVDRAVAMLRKWGIKDGFINASGDIYALGHAEDGEAWKVGVRSPNDPDAIVATAEVSDAAIATSGDYEQFFLYQGRRYHHIMDPHTAAPRLTDTHTITIQADDCLSCDAGSTTLFGMDRAQGARVLATRAVNARVVA